MITRLPFHSVRRNIVHFRGKENQENHFEPAPSSPKIEDSEANFTRVKTAPAPSRSLGLPSGPTRRSAMSGQVVLYFEDQADALRFALAAGSVMAGEGGKVTDNLVEETTRVSRIRLDAVTAGGSKKPNPVRAA